MKLKYIGRHDTFRDNIYGSNLTWIKGVTVLDVPEKFAVKLAQHSALFVVVDDAATAPAVIAEAKPVDDQAELMRDSINRMDIDSLASFAFVNFAGFAIDKSAPVEQVRKDIVSMIDRFGTSFEAPPAAEGPALESAGLADVADRPEVKGLEVLVDKADASPDADAEKTEEPQPTDILPQIMAMHAEGKKPGEIGKTFGLHHTRVASIIKHQTENSEA